MKARALLVLPWALTLWGEPAADALSGMTLEQLLSLNVTTVGKKQQRLDRAAAAVYVITQEDIRRMGVTSIPEALRLAPGLHVARINGRTWAISARGFNSVFSNKLLVLMDGRSLYTPLFSGVWWDQDVMLEDVDRIEVIRGPAAAIWGANAVNGVINIITRRADQTRGNLLSATVGSEDRSITRFRHGGEVGRTGSYRVYGQYSHRVLASPAPQFGDSYWGTLQGGFRIDAAPRPGQEILLQADIAQGTGSEFEHDSFPMFVPATVQRLQNRRNAGDVLGRWTITHRSGATTTIQGYYDEVNRYTTEADVDFDLDTVDGEIQHRRMLGRRHELTLSTGYRFIQDQTEEMGPARLVPEGLTYGIGQVSAVDGIGLWNDAVQLTLGARLEHNKFSRWSVQPTARALWSVTRRHSVWTAVSRAIRAPSRLEFGGERFSLSSGIGFRGNTGLRAETLLAYEAGYRAKLKRFIVDVSGFRNGYDHLVSFEPGGPGPAPGGRIGYWIDMRNLAQTRSWGLETSAAWEAAAGWRVSGSYTGLWMRQLLRPESRDPRWLASARADPRHQWQANSNLRLWQGWQWSAFVFYYGKSSIRSGPAGPETEVPRHVRLDTSLSRRIGESAEIRFGARNLGSHGVHEYFVQAGPAPEPIRRAVYCRMTWWF